MLIILSPAAQSSLCTKDTATITINAQADVTQISDCSTVAGSVVIGPLAKGNIDLSGPTEISGSLIANNAPDLSGISSTSLTTLSTDKNATFNVFNATGLNTIQFDSLTQVGTINWVSLGALVTLSFASTITKAESITITDTFLSTIPGLNLTTVGTMDINNNGRLNNFTSTIRTISNSLNVASNGGSLDITFPNLIWVNDAVFRDVTTLSVPILAKVNSSLIFDSNKFATISAPSLKTVGNKDTRVGSLSYVGNKLLKNITTPGLTLVGGGIQIANNTILEDLSFPVLDTVGGAVDLSGNFSNPDFPKLTNVVGAMNVQSTNDINCDFFNGLQGGVVQGEVNCVSKTNDPESLDPNSTGTSSSGGAKPTKSKGASPTFGVSEAAAGLSVVGGLLQMLL